MTSVVQESLSETDQLGSLTVVHSHTCHAVHCLKNFALEHNNNNNNNNNNIPVKLSNLDVSVMFAR